MLAVSALILFAGVWLLLHRQFDIDELEHAHAAWSVGHGDVPYRDFFEHHTPALHIMFAPLFRVMAPETGIDAAARTLATGRLVMWLLAAAGLALTYRIANHWDEPAGARHGALAVFLLATSFQYLNTMMEFRPDVPALVCMLAAFVCLFESMHAENAGQWRWHVAAGMAFGASLMFTQKTIFAAPGLLFGVIAARRSRVLAGFLIGLLLPIAAVGIGFAAYGAFGVFVDDVVVRNLAINADRRSPLPGLFGGALRNLPLYSAGITGAVIALRSKRRDGRAVLLVTLGSLAIGVFTIGRVYDQYYLLMLPLWAVLGAAAIAGWTAPKSMPSRSRSWTTAAVAAAAVTFLATAVVTQYESNGPQLDEMRFAIEQVPPGESVLSGIPGAGTFRPHAWYYFFLVGPFADDHDYAALRAALEAERIRPRLVIFDEPVRAMPPGVLAYLRAHYDAVRGEFSLRRD